MQPFVSSSELEVMLRRDLDAAAATQAVESASDEIRGHTKQTITEATTEGATFRPLPSGRTIVLAELPVDPDTVTIELGGEPFTDFKVEAETGLLTRTDGACWPDEIVVTYTHGYPADHPRLRTARRVALYAAARIYTNPEQTMTKRRGDYSTGYGSSTVESSGLTTWERALLSSVYPHPRHRF